MHVRLFVFMIVLYLHHSLTIIVSISKRLFQSFPLREFSFEYNTKLSTFEVPLVTPQGPAYGRTEVLHASSWHASCTQSLCPAIVLPEVDGALRQRTLSQDTQDMVLTWKTSEGQVAFQCYPVRDTGASVLAAAGRAVLTFRKSSLLHWVCKQVFKFVAKAVNRIKITNKVSCPYKEQHKYLQQDDWPTCTTGHTRSSGENGQDQFRRSRVFIAEVALIVIML